MKIALFDLDWTIRKPASGGRFSKGGNPFDQVLMPGRLEKLWRLVEEGWEVAGISNQAEVEAGYKTLENCIREQQYTMELLGLDFPIWFCPDSAGRDCYLMTKTKANKLTDSFGISFRKPDPGMLLRAVDYFSFLGTSHLTKLIYVGDLDSDKEAVNRFNQLDFELRLGSMDFCWSQDFFQGEK